MTVEKIDENSNPLYNHAKLFVNNEDKTFDKNTIGQGLEELGEKRGPYIRGAVISGFNKTHGGCPFKPNPETGYASKLHLGTTRIWNPDGSVNENRWQKLVDFVTEGQEENQEKRVYKNKLLDYLDYCFKNDPHETKTGRYGGFFSTASVQKFAASAAWEQVFDLLCGQEQNPSISLTELRQFFTDGDKLFQEHARNQGSLQF